MYTASGTKAYAQVSIESGVMSANPHQLIEMLFDGANSALVRARLFMQQGDMLKFSQILVRTLVLAASAAALGGCGQRGPLYLPTGPAATQRATLPETLTPGGSSTAPAPAAAASATR